MSVYNIAHVFLNMCVYVYVSAVCVWGGGGGGRGVVIVHIFHSFVKFFIISSHFLSTKRISRFC